MLMNGLYAARFLGIRTAEASKSSLTTGQRNEIGTSLVKSQEFFTIIKKTSMDFSSTEWIRNVAWKAIDRALDVR